MTLAWETVFDEAKPNRPLIDADRERELDLLAAPLTSDELAEVAACVGMPVDAIRAENPVATNGLPAELIDLYRWCDGGEFRIGERYFAPLLRLAEIREYLVAYGVIHWRPGCIPFAMDGNACFYLLDLSRRPAPVVFVGSDELDNPAIAPRLGDALAAVFEDGRSPIAVTAKRS